MLESLLLPEKTPLLLAFAGIHRPRTLNPNAEVLRADKIELYANLLIVGAFGRCKELTPPSLVRVVAVDTRHEQK